jgi:flagellar motor switch protein FliG
MKAQKKVIEEESLTFDNHNFITVLVNNMSNESSTKLFEKVNRIDAGFARVLRKDIFFLEDLVQADNSLIENIIRQIDRDLLVGYLSFSQVLIKEKFFRSMTSRNRDIYKDELENFISIKDDEKAQIQDQMLAEIRQIMAVV